VSTTDPDSAGTALLDACVLVPIRLTTTLLWLAEAGLFEVLWSDAILDEVERNLPKVGISSEQAARRVGTMRRAFGAAAQVDDFERLIPDMTCDAKDRHVLAAAVRGGADTLVTFNRKDFPPESTDGHGIAVVHPDLFLARLLAQRPNDVLAALQRGTAALRKPPQTMREFLASLTSTVPIFANLAADAAANPPEPTSPVPALVAADEDEAVAAFGEAGDFTNPAQVAFGWWAGLLDDLDLARALTFDPSAWSDYQWAIDMSSGKSLASKVIPAVDAPQYVAFMRFVPEVATAAQVFSTYFTSATILVLVKIEDGTWRVWGLGDGMPAARDILGEEFARAQQFVVGGGTALVFEWLTRIAETNPPVELIWGSLDDPLRLCMAQSWLLGTGEITADHPQRDAQAEQLAARKSTHPLFEQFYRWLVAHYQNVYSAIDGKPCLVGATETVGVDLELIGFASEEYVGSYEAGQPFPAHTFITRHVGEGKWVIAANARRMPVPGWPPTEQVLPGLLIDGN
jgi:predicted nucleic acid-binding protein